MLDKISDLIWDFNDMPDNIKCGIAVRNRLDELGIHNYSDKIFGEYVRRMKKMKRMEE